MKGIILGIISGIIPGLHPNLFGKFLGIQSIILMLIFYRFFSYVREIFFMVPSDSNALSLHPMYKMYRRGYGMKALLLSTTGLLISILISTVLAPLLVYLVPKLYQYSFVVGIPFLVLSLIFIIITENKKLNATLVILLSGLVGFFALQIKNGIVPLLSGLFSLPILTSKVGKRVNQKTVKRIKIKPKNLIIGALSSIVLITTPAIGPTQSAIFAKGLLKDEDFLFTMGLIDGLDIIFSIVLILTIGRARIGALQESRYKVINQSLIPEMIALALVGSIVAYILAIEISRIIIKRNFNVEKLKYISLIVISIVSLYLCGVLGLIILFVSGLIGVLASKLKVRMVNCMGSLAIPVLINKIF